MRFFFAYSSAIFSLFGHWQHSCVATIGHKITTMNEKDMPQDPAFADNSTGFTPEELINDINADENVAGTTHLNEAVGEDGLAEKLQSELQEQKDKYLRLFAEFDNYKRRNARERLDLMQTANREVLTALLDVLDDTERTEKALATAADLQVAKEGIALVFNKLRSVLQQKGLKVMDSLQADFNADLHEAITEIPAPDKKLVGKVLDEVQKGYYLNDKIIRFAKVVVGK
jgi:molecular chaperone GrpE